MKMENFAVFLLVLVVVTNECVIAKQAYTSDGPILIPSKREYKVNVGHNLTLECRGNQSLSWKLPESISDAVLIDNGDISSYTNPNGTYTSLLTMYNMTNIYKGFYFCYYNTTENYTDYDNYVEAFERLANESEAVGIYVNVGEANPSDAPILKPSEKEQIVTVGHNLVLECIGNQPLSWKLPEIQTEETITNSNISYSISPNDIYRSLLVVYNVTTNDVGYYFCYYNTTENNNDYYNYVEVFKKIENDYEAVGVYVYVEDPENLLVPKDSIIQGTQYKTITIPCLPSSPDVMVKLYQNGVEVEDVDYDPREGFSFLPKKILEPIFTCKFSNGSKEDELTIFVHFTSFTNTVRKPKINVSNNGKVVVNERLELECTVVADRNVPFELKWTYPNKKLMGNEFRKSETKYIDEKSSSMTSQRTGATKLIIYKATYEDAGNYTCEIVDYHKNSASCDKYVTILEEGHSHIRLYEEANKHTIEIGSGKHARWVIYFDAYPKPIITWYDNKNNEISQPNNKYTIKMDDADSSTTIMINNVTLDDRGVYRVHGVSGSTETSLNLTLTVTSNPQINIESKQYYMDGQMENILCMVRGYPLPQISWYFQECNDSATNCSKPRDKIKTVNNENVDDVTIRSIAKMEIHNSGFLYCNANINKKEFKKSAYFYATDIKDGFGINDIDGPIAVGDNVALNCTALIQTHKNEFLQWYKDGTPIIEGNNKYILESSNTRLSRKLNLYISDITNTQNGKYECRSKTMYEDFEQQEIQIDVKDIIPPTIQSTLNNTDYKLTIGKPEIKFICKASGIPKPELKWYKDEELIKTNDRVQLVDNGNELFFKYFVEEDEGNYKCVANSRVGRAEAFTKLYIEYGKIKPLYIGIIVVMLIAFVILVSVLIHKIRKEKQIRKELSRMGLLHFEDGATESLNPDLGVDEQAELLPYDKKWEFPREKLKLGKQLGSGAFGVVMKATAYSILSEEDVTTVAVKMVKKTADPTFIKALASELKIMVHLGKHLNVVNLLGACTKNVTKRELFVIVEYCRFGNLHNYLLRHRDHFIDQIDHNTDNIDVTIGSEITDRAYSVSSSKSSYPQSGLKSVTQPLLSRSSGSRDDHIDSPTINTANTFVSMTPTGDDAPITSSGSVQPEWRSNYKGDYNYSKDVRPITTQDLLGWSFQVARGMEYLANRKVLHGDLAARNILLADNNIVKICDFGLAKNMYKTDNYKKKGDGPLPVKWMAIESIRDRVFSTQSDVWSYGIVLWELFSLARTPYPGMNADEKFYNKLVEGYRMEKPLYANNKIYNTMLECWRARPVQRPTFSDLAEKLGNLLEDGVRKLYIDLNDPYMDMNNRWLAERGDNDYLAMMCSPDYGNLTSATIKHEYVNDPFGGPTRVNPLSPDDTDAGGYLLMSPAKKGVITESSVFNFPPLNPPNRSNIVNESEKEEQKNEWIPMLQVHNQPQRPGSDSDLGESTPASPNFAENQRNGMPSYSNPNYTPMTGIVDNKKYPDDLIIVNDKYPDTSTKDGGFCEKMVDDSVSAFTNPSYVTMDFNHQKPFKNNIYTNVPPNVVM